MHEQRDYSPLDRLLDQADQAIRTVFGAAHAARPNPAAAVPPPELSRAETRHSAGLMRVNHSGEVCAQALYQGQALTARKTRVRAALQHAAQEENDHLSWCQDRLRELDSHTSYLNPLWYCGSFAMGAAAGLLGDAWSLGFLAETERQVVNHLDDHLKRLPAADAKSSAILRQMSADEQQHATTAVRAGGRDLPEPVRALMRFTSRLMTRTAYRI